MCTFFFAATLDCCSDTRKSLGPSAPIAYATSVSPPNEAAAWPGRRCWVANNAAAWSGRRCWMLDMPATWPVRRSSKSPRTLPKCKYLITKQLTFIAMRGDLLEGNGCTSRFQSPSSRAQKLHFCAFLAFETLVFWLFEHKIEVFVRF